MSPSLGRCPPAARGDRALDLARRGSDGRACGGRRAGGRGRYGRGCARVARQLRTARGEALARPRAPGEGRRQPLVPGGRPPARRKVAPCPSHGRWRSRCGRRGRTGSRRDWAGTAPPGAGAACSRGCWTSGASASSSTLGSRTALAWSCAPRMRAADDPRSARARRRADAVRARRRRGFERVRPRLPRRFADRGGDPPSPLAPPEAAPVAVGGACLGRHRAADRGAPRGTDPALDRRRWGGKLLPPDPPNGGGGPGPGSGLARPRADRRGGRRRRARRARRLRPRAVASDRPHPLRSRGRRRTSTPPTRPGTGGCSGSPASGRGPCRCSGSAAAASPTRCPRATSPTSSSSACSTASGAGRRSPRSRSTSPPTRRSGASPAASPSSAGTGPWPRRRRSGRGLSADLPGPRQAAARW